MADQAAVLLHQRRFVGLQVTDQLGQGDVGLQCCVLQRVGDLLHQGVLSAFCQLRDPVAGTRIAGAERAQPIEQVREIQRRPLHGDQYRVGGAERAEALPDCSERVAFALRFVRSEFFRGPRDDLAGFRRSLPNLVRDAASVGEDGCVRVGEDAVPAELLRQRGEAVPDGGRLAGEIRDEV